MGVKELWAVLNKVADEEELAWARERLEERLGLPLRAAIPFDRAIVEADRAGASPLDACPGSPAVKAIEELAREVLSFMAERAGA